MKTDELEFNLLFGAERSWPGSGALVLTVLRSRQRRGDDLALLLLIKMVLQNPGPTRLEALAALRREIPKATRGARLLRYNAAMEAMDKLDALAKGKAP